MNNSIAILSLTDCIGGAELLLTNLFKYKKSCTDFYFLTHNAQNKVKGENIYYLSETSIFSIGFFEMLFFSKKLNNYKVIISSHIYLNSVLGLFKKLGILNKNVKLVFRESTSIFIREKGIRLLKYRIAYRLGYGIQDLVITQSELMKQQLMDNLPESKNWKIHPISNPIDLDLIIKQSQQYIPKDRGYIITAGRLIPEKGFDILIKAFSSIEKDIGEKHLFILGEGSERKKLEDLIDSLKLNNKVKLLGFKENPMPYFKYADLCVVSSRVEGFPNVLLQMMALNGNVVSTLCAGGIEDLEGVQTCEVNNVNLLAVTILKAIRERINNLEKFRSELEKRSVAKYWNKVETFLHES